MTGEKPLGVVLLQLGRPGFARERRTVPVQPLLRSGHHRPSAGLSLPEAARAVHLRKTRAQGAGILPEDRRAITDPQADAPPGRCAGARAPPPPPREGGHRDAVLAPDDRGGDRRARGGGRRTRGAAPAVPPVLEDHDRLKRERVEPHGGAARHHPAACGSHREYCEHPSYIAALVQNIGIALRRIPAADRAKVHLVFSAHGTPMHAGARRGSVRAADRPDVQRRPEGGKLRSPHHLCYQSKVGPQKWLEPSLDHTIDRLAREKASHMLVVPIAFVSDHSETLWEINMEARASGEGARNQVLRHDSGASHES